MEQTVLNKTEFTPCCGRIIIEFTQEQMQTYNVRISDGMKLIISDEWHPAEWSIEEATIHAVSECQKDFRPGESVLIDYGIFSAGRYARERKTMHYSRLLKKREDGSALYWAYDNQHPANSSEIYARIDDEGRVTGLHDAVICYRKEAQEKEEDKLIDVVQNLDMVNGTSSVVADFPGCEWNKVYSSPIPEIPDNSVILCEKDFSPSIKFRGIELQYINLAFILGIYDENKPHNVRLF